MNSRRIAGVLAAFIFMFATAGTVAAQDEITITVNRFASLSEGTAVIRVSGTIVCATTGEVNLRTRGTQRGLTASDNFDLAPFICSPTPSDFRTSVESLSCSPDTRSNCFRPGRALIEIFYFDGTTPLVSAWVTVRPSNVST